ncbi:YegP family protein [Nocardia sp. NPDC058666]|uniref:YegP family protein n=1 Tax=Nocardia sp. NPDC058666 TaxID=3346587 RepID=UPI00365CAC14
MAGKFEVFVDKAGKFHFHLKAGNGEIVLESQGYESKEGAKKGIASIQTNAPGAEIVDLSVT